jgi:mannose-1-phosphate guanylyltransferase
MTNITALVLAAGYGTRLLPLTKKWPKCLMPIANRPLLEHWLEKLYILGIEKVLVNTHYRAIDVRNFLNRDIFSGWVHEVYESKLLGTAGTIRQNSKILADSHVLVIHGDNWCQCDLTAFIEYHLFYRPKGSLLTMMTFDTQNPSSCGIVKLDSQGMVVEFYEKTPSPPGNVANAAIYMLSQEVINWLIVNPNVDDFSNQVLPNFIGRIATWKNHGILRDIGSIEQLRECQKDPVIYPLWPQNDEWSRLFLASKKFKEINKLIHNI